MVASVAGEGIKRNTNWLAFLEEVGYDVFRKGVTVVLERLKCFKSGPRAMNNDGALRDAVFALKECPDCA